MKTNRKTSRKANTKTNTKTNREDRKLIGNEQKKKWKMKK
jgi:hypothetical protein